MVATAPAPGSRQPAGSPAGPGVSATSTWAESLAEGGGEGADAPARPRAGAAGQRRGERPAEVLVGGGALGEQPAGLGGEVDRGGERRVAGVRGSIRPPSSSHR